MQGARGSVLMGGGQLWARGRHRVLAYFATYPVLPARSPALTAHDPRRWPRPPLTSQLGKSSLLTIHHFLDIYDG